MTVTQEQLSSIKNSIDTRKKVKSAKPLDPMGYLAYDESPGIAKMLSLLYLNLVRDNPRELVRMYHLAPSMIQKTRQLMKEKGRTEENEGVAKNNGHAVANVLDCYWFQPLLEDDWDGVGQRMLNPDEQSIHSNSYDKTKVMPQIGLGVDSSIVNSDAGKVVFLLADGGNGTGINSSPSAIQAWVNKFTDIDGDVASLKPNFDFNYSVELIEQALTDNPVYIELYLDHLDFCPFGTDDVEAARRRVIQIFQNFNNGSAADIPHCINNVHMTYNEPGCGERDIADVLKNTMISAGTSCGMENDAIGKYAGSFEKLITTLINNKMNMGTTGWMEACFHLSARTTVVRNDTNGWIDMDPMVWHYVLRSGVEDYKQMGVTINHKSDEFQKIVGEFEKILTLFIKNGPLQSLSNMVNVSIELNEGWEANKYTQYETAARVILELHTHIFGSDSWDRLFGVKGAINRNALREYSVTDPDGNARVHKLNKLSYYTGVKNKSYFFKDGKEPIKTLDQLIKVVNPNGADMVKRKQEFEERRRQREEEQAREDREMAELGLS